MIAARPLSLGMGDRGRIKGAAFRQFAIWWRAARGVDQVAAAHARMDPEWARRLNPDSDALGILASQWYPAELPHALIDALLADVSATAHWSVAGEAAGAVMSANLRGVYKAVFSLLATPERYLKHVQRIWDMHYDTGRVRINAVAPNAHESETCDWKGHHHFICKLNMASVVPIYTAMGCEDVTFERRTCVDEGAPGCRSIIRWK